MEFVLDEEQQILRDSAATFVRDRSPLSRIRALRDSGDGDGFSRELWREMADLGWLGIPFPEDAGGLGLGLKDLGVVLEELGRGLLPEPLLSTVLLGGSAVLLAGSDAQKQSLLGDVIAGRHLLALAYQESGARGDPLRVDASARRDGARWVLNGEKILVADGHAADTLIVSARSAGTQRDRDGIGLFLVGADTPGLERHRQHMLDSRGAAIVRLNDVRVEDTSVLGDAGAGGAVLERVIDRATAGLCAEMVGTMSAAFAMTLDYLKTRKQFGVAIGSFQALKHRAAQLFTEIELARSAALAAAMAIDEDNPRSAEIVSVAKARCSDAILLAANEGVQMHGGIGMTDEHDIGFYFKRARVAATTFGDAAAHRERFARLNGF